MDLQDKIISVILVVIAGIIIFQPEVPFLEFILDNALWVIIAYVGLGMLLLLLKKKNLVYVSLICSAVITLYLKDVSNASLKYDKLDTSLPNIEICHFNVFDFEGDNVELLKSIRSLNPSILSFEVLSPTMNKYLINNLKDKYKYNTYINRGGDIDSKLILSKLPIYDIDTFYLSGHPQLKLRVSDKDRNINLICSSISPFIDNNGNSLSNKQINDLTSYIYSSIDRNLPTILIGEFNQVYWSKNIRYLLSQTKLNNARRYVYLTRRNPYEHIFYSDGLVCLKLDEVFDNSNNNIGIVGKFIMNFKKG